MSEPTFIKHKKFNFTQSQSLLTTLDQDIFHVLFSVQGARNSDGPPRLSYTHRWLS